MVEIMHNDNISVSSVVIPPILNGTACSILVEPATRLHLDMLHEPVKGMFMMMEYMVITILKMNTMETPTESVEQHKLFLYIYFSNHSNS
jgi:hypothetical protein